MVTFFTRGKIGTYSWINIGCQMQCLDVTRWHWDPFCEMSEDVWHISSQTKGKRTIFCLFFQCWRRQWVVLDIVDTVSATPALIARIYGSHIHEDRSLPVATVTMSDVHALHRTQSRYVDNKPWILASLPFMTSFQMDENPLPSWLFEFFMSFPPFFDHFAVIFSRPGVPISFRVQNPVSLSILSRLNGHTSRVALEKKRFRLSWKCFPKKLKKIL